MKNIVLILAILVSFHCLKAQSTGPTDTLLLPSYDNLVGNPTLLNYGYSNGNGYFFGTNFLDVDQDPTTPYEPGAQAVAQGFTVDSGGMHIIDIMVHVGNTIQGATSNGSPLILSVHYLDDSSTYNINTSSGTVSYTIGAPGTSLGSTSIPWDEIKTGGINNYSTAHLSSPIYVDKNFVIVLDFFDFYLNGDRIGMFASPPNGSSIYGKEFTLWLYPNPLLWLQVDHIFTSMNRAISIFPVIDDGTYGIQDDSFVSGIKLGQSYPNPAATETTIEYEIAKASQVRLEIMNSEGKLIRTIELGKKAAGNHEFTLETIDLESGMYYYTLRTEQSFLCKKLIVNN